MVHKGLNGCPIFCEETLEKIMSKRYKNLLPISCKGTLSTTLPISCEGTLATVSTHKWKDYCVQKINKI